MRATIDCKNGLWLLEKWTEKALECPGSVVVGKWPNNAPYKKGPKKKKKKFKARSSIKF